MDGGRLSAKNSSRFPFPCLPEFGAYNKNFSLLLREGGDAANLVCVKD